MRELVHLQQQCALVCTSRVVLHWPCQSRGYLHAVYPVHPEALTCLGKHFWLPCWPMSPSAFPPPLSLSPSFSVRESSWWLTELCHENWGGSSFSHVRRSGLLRCCGEAGFNFCAQAKVLCVGSSIA